VRIVSWNLQHGVPDPKGPPDLLRAVPALRALEGDVYALQELDRRRVRTRWVDQGEQLADALDGELVWGRGKRGALWAQGNALVVRGEVSEQDVVVLPAAGERRVAAVAVVMVAGHRHTVASTHLSLQHQGALHQLRSLVAALVDHPKPWVIAGDLNLTTERVLPLALELGLTLVAGPATVDARRTPDRRIDHLLVDGLAVVDSGVAKLPVSDHLAIWADLA
jgi:endonuclease/exonuclease/phosphatase family metal-dependent hydrolase